MKNFYGSYETFLFMLAPKEIKFPATGKNNNYIYSCKDYFLFGDGEFH